MTEARAISDGRVDLKALIEAAKKATPGEWVATTDDDDDKLVTHIVRPVKRDRKGTRYIDVLPRFEFPNFGEQQPNNEADATFIALANPSTVAAMAEELMALREAAKQAEKAIDAMRTGISVHNGRMPTSDYPIVGPVVNALTEAQIVLRDLLSRDAAHV
jgi:hypothetical protein